MARAVISGGKGYSFRVREEVRSRAAYALLTGFDDRLGAVGAASDRIEGGLARWVGFQGGSHAPDHASELSHEVGKTIHNSGIFTRDHA